MIGLSVLLMLAGLALFAVAVAREAAQAHAAGDTMRTPLLLKTAIAVIVAGFAVFLAAPEAKAQTSCAPWTAMTRSLLERYGEVPIGGGLINQNTRLEVTTSVSGGTWSILAVDVFGNACMIVNGVGWDPGKLPAARTAVVEKEG